MTLCTFQNTINSAIFYALHATNTGLTAVVQPSGQISTLLPQFTPGVLQATITPTTGLTPYARWGDIGVWLLSGVSLLIAWFLNRPRLPPPPSQQ